MSYSNYPPGVTGAEYEIAGPDREEDEERECEYCGEVANVTVSYYKLEAWWTCPTCDNTNVDEDDGINFIDPED